MCGGCWRALLTSSGTDARSARTWRGVLAELIGTLLLVFVGCGACLGGGDWEAAPAPTTVQISLTFGLAVATLAWALGHASGGHFNPVRYAAI